MSEGALFKVFASGSLEQVGALDTIDPAGWSRAVEDAQQHQCAPMFRRRLAELGILDQMSDDAQRLLTRSALDTTVQNLRGTHQLYELAREMRGVPLIALKGACLARTCYRDVSLRPMRDLDVLVRECDLGAARQALGRLGYRQDLRIDPDLNPMHDPPYFKQGAIHIELHRTLLDDRDGFAIDYSALWSRASSVKDIPGLFYLSLEDQLLHVCLHAGYHHRFDIGLYAFIDIAMLARCSGLDWAAFIASAREWNAARCVFLTLETARIMAAAEIPPAVLTALRPSDIGPAIIPMAIAAVRHRCPTGYAPAAFLSRFIVDILFERGWRSIPGRLQRRFLRPPERRMQWRGSPHGVGWYGQLAPLFVGITALVHRRAERERLVASLNGMRVRRWMTRSDAAASR